MNLLLKVFLFHSRWRITKPMCCSRRLHWCVDKRWCLVYYHPTVPSEFTLINVWQVFVCFSNTFPWLSWSKRTPGKKFIIQWCTQAQVCVYFMYATVLETGLLIFRGKKSKISRDFQGQIRGKIGRFRGIFAGKKSKFAEQSANFGRFSREKSQNSQKNWHISHDFSGKKSIFEGFSGANS